MKRTLITHIGGSQREGWLYLMDGDTILYESENDGRAYLRRGAERHEEAMTVAEAVRRWPLHAKEIVTAVEKAQGVRQ